MTVLFDEHGRQLAWLAQLEPDWEDDGEYHETNMYVFDFYHDSELPPTEDGSDEDITWTRRQPNCVTSYCPETGKHKLVLDLDFECRLVPSSSPGCYHLYLDGLDLDAVQARAVVRAMGVQGVLEAGFAKTMSRDGRVCVRTTDTKKFRPKPPNGEGHKVTKLRVDWGDNDSSS